MKKLSLPLFLIVCFSLLYSCEKVEDKYELRFTNTSSNPYAVEVDGTTISLSGNSYKNYNLDLGTYSWRVTQESGYLIYPTVKEGTVNLTEDKEVVFP